MAEVRDGSLAAMFGRQSPLYDRAARAIGLRDDGDIETLVRRALQSR